VVSNCGAFDTIFTTDQGYHGISHKDHHVARILDNFVATTLAKYLQSIVGFIQACYSPHIDLDNLTPVLLAMRWLDPQMASTCMDLQF